MVMSWINLVRFNECDGKKKRDKVSKKYEKVCESLC